MSDYNRAAKNYWSVTVGAGVIVFGWSLLGTLTLSHLGLVEFAVLLLLVVFAGLHPLRIPNKKSSFTAGDVFIFLGVLLLGVPAAVLIGIADSLVSSRRNSQKPPSSIAAPAMMAISVFLAGNAFYLVLQLVAPGVKYPLGATPLPVENLCAALAAMALVHYLVNGFAISTIYALKCRQPIFKFWREGYLWTWWSFLASAIATAVIFAAVSRFGWGYLLLSVPVVAATFWTYKVFFDQVKAQTREAEELSRLHLATVEALATAIDAKDQTSHCHVRRVQIYAAGLGQL
jgi:hypothetical protein